MKTKRILVVHAGGIGDLLLALPAMRLFCQNFVPYSLELLGYSERLAVIEHDLRAERIHSIDRAEISYLYSGAKRLPHNLKSFFSSFDIALIFGKSLGESWKESLEKMGLNKVFLLETFPDYNEKVHVSDYLIAGLKERGFCGEEKIKPLLLPQRAREFALQFWEENHIKSDQKVLAIHPGSGHPAKNWSAANFAKVADHFASLAEILLIFGPAEEGVEKIVKELKKVRPIIVHDLPLIKLAGLLARCAAFLGNDSGITHLAASLGIPTIAIFGPTDPKAWGPKGMKTQILYTNQSCSPCWPKVPENCLRPCLNTIDPKTVIEKIITWAKFAEK